MKTNIINVNGVDVELEGTPVDNSVTTQKVVDKAITKAKLADAVQTSLGKADSALQPSALNPYRTAANQDAIDNAIKDRATAIEGKIPSQASSSNQLADKSFVNSSIATETATFRGTSASGLSEAQFLTWANGLTKDNNDYVFWNTVDGSGNAQFKRYKYNGSSWVYEYTLNNSSFTSAQWAAINSGLTSTDKTALDAALAFIETFGNIVTHNVSEFATAAQGGKADTALQPSALAPYRTSGAQDVIDNGKVDKVTGKGLSTNDYDNTEKGKVATALQPAALNPYRTSQAQDTIDSQKANKDGYYQTLSAGYADKAADLDIHTSTMVHHTQVKPMDTTGGDKDVKDGNGFIRVIRGTENGITAAGAKIISFGFNLIPSGSGTTFTFRCVKGEWGAYGTSEKNNGYIFTDAQGNILVPTSVKQNNVSVPTHTDHGKTYYLPSQDGQCTVVFATSQTNPCAHICWSNGRDNDYEAYNASQKDLASAITAIGGTLRRVGYVFDEVNLETKQSIRRLGYRLLNALSWTMEAGPTPEEGEATNTFRAVVSGGVASSDTIKAGGAFAIKGVSGLTFSLDGTSLVCDSTIASVADFVTALGSGTIEYELAVPVVATNSLNGEITISDYGIIIFENTAGASVVDIDFDFDQKWIDFVKNLPNDLDVTNRVIAEALVNLNERLSGIEAMVENGFPSLKVNDLTIARALFTRIALGDAFVAKAGAPSTIPAGVLQFYRNTTDGSIYLSVGSESTSDWIKIK